MRYLQFILLPIIVFVLIGCSEDDSNPAAPAKTQVLMPLSIGNYWMYQRMRYDNGEYRFSRIDTTTIVEEMKDSSGVNWYVGSRWGGFRNTSQGLEFYFGMFLLKYPASVGDFFAVSPKWLVTLQHTDTLVTTPSGDFRCLRYGFGRPGETEERHYYSPGVGLVRNETLHWTYLGESRYDSVCTSFSELIDYHLE
jgi:hypothetical protein